ncbi:hypothetical protein O6H91_23G013300 [Diphasiastrum complanatum]|uniref:Uncharacterized protein n=1 Tax=Diphasiastrum complanatum TaxID=34168 RepID=A0ACC2A884_DIPCM|nr:hypothetical protein O6H91_23G013300 [Diphasiastrum complanatum]
MLKQSLRQAVSIAVLVAITGFYKELQTYASVISSTSALENEEKTKIPSIGPSFEENFVMFGCHAWELQIAVEIANQVWEQSLLKAFYAFQVPVNLFHGDVGLVSIDAYEEGRHISNLWRHFFIVHDNGAYRVDAEINMLFSTCTSTKNEEANAESVVDETHKIKEAARVVAMRSYDHFVAKYMVCLKEPLREICPLQILEGNFMEFVPKHRHTSIELRKIIVEEHPTASVEPLEPAGNSVIKCQSWCLIFGWWQIQTWHLASLVIFMMVIQSFNYLLGSFLEIDDLSQAMKSEAVGRKEYDCIASWQLRFGCPSQGRSLKGTPRLKRSSDLLSSGEGCYQEAWVEAEYHLGQLINSYSEGACFYYNCSTQSNDKQVQQPWCWNRDSVGRLTRL